MSNSNWVSSAARHRLMQQIRDMDNGLLAPGTLRGYYLVFSHTKRRYWLGEKLSDAVNNLNRACEKYLTDAEYQYWVDYSLGLDVAGNPAWSNVDHVDSLYDKEMSLYC